MENEEIEKIIPSKLPFSPEDKIFFAIDEETGEIIGEKYSYNDWLKEIENISGLSDEFKNAPNHKNTLGRSSFRKRC